MPINDSIIDITGLFQRLERALADTTPPPSSVTQISQNFYSYEPPSLGKLYGQKLGLTARQIGWLDKFYLPANTFLTIEGARQATALLYTTALLEVDRQLKTTGTTLAKEVDRLEQQARQLRYRYNSWYHGSTKGDKVGADFYLAAFRQCENAVRTHFDYTRKTTSLFVKQIADIEPEYQQRLGHRIQALLPTLVTQVPSPDHSTELALNAQSTNRWKTRLERLAARLPAGVPGFVAGVTKLGELNKLNPVRSSLFFEAARLAAPVSREAALRFYLHYLYHDNATLRPAKPLPKALQKLLFPLPENQARFEAISRELAHAFNLDAALAQVPAVYEVKRREIKLDKKAIHAVRDQHAGTVELLNEYLRDEPEPAPPPPAAKPAAKPTPAPKATKPAKTAKPAKAVPAAAAGAFALALDLSATQQALLRLFAAHGLTLTKAAVDAFAQQHGALRNQLLDGLNEACYELLDDVLLEETDDTYTIYKPYYQKITR